MAETDENADLVARHIGPGVWEDANGNLHFSLPDILAFTGLPDTPDNQKKLAEMISTMVRKKEQDALIIQRDKT